MQAVPPASQQWPLSLKTIKIKILVSSSLPPEPFLFLSSSLKILSSSGSALFPLLSNEFFISFTEFVSSELFVWFVGWLVGWF